MSVNLGFFSQCVGAGNTTDLKWCEHPGCTLLGIQVLSTANWLTRKEAVKQMSVEIQAFTVLE